ncbi:FliI/YscN family ATPase [Rhizobium helianthi]|uniref:FliI/YscN family ATPase n=1 Tax=Rhizobium helianthi TaxID=1132695 RepID=A0ABW4M883_9HYPH
MADVLTKLETILDKTETRRFAGRIRSISGLVVRAEMPLVRIGELCELREPGRGVIGLAEVVGIENDTAILSLHGETLGLSLRTEVIPSGKPPGLMVGDFLIGAIIDAHGNVIRKPFAPADAQEARFQPLHCQPVDPLSRRPIQNPFETGVTALDAMLTCGEGQRIGIFGPPGAGKSTLISRILETGSFDVAVCALIGERGREVAEFVEHNMPANRPSRMVLVSSTSDRPSLERYKAVLTATAIAEYFRDQGRRVLLVIDSMTRVARALREIGLAAGEPPVRRGFPPSVFAALPQIFERTGNGAKGSITAFYSVLSEGNDNDDPIAEETRSLLDGHIILSDRIARSGRYPAIDVLQSKSRTMNAVVSDNHISAANRIRSLLSTYADVELLIRVGEYKPGNDPEVDEAVAKRDAINALLYDGRGGTRSYEETIQALMELA